MSILAPPSPVRDPRKPTSIEIRLKDTIFNTTLCPNHFDAQYCHLRNSNPKETQSDVVETTLNGANENDACTEFNLLNPN